MTGDDSRILLFGLGVMWLFIGALARTESNHRASVITKLIHYLPPAIFMAPLVLQAYIAAILS